MRSDWVLADSGVTLVVESMTYSEPVSINGWLDDWSGTYQPGELAYTRNHSALIYQSAQGWRVGVRARFDYVAKFSEPLAHFYYLNQRGAAEQSASAPLYLDIQHVRASGALLGLAWQASPSFTVGLDITLWQADDLLDGALVGNFAIDSEGVIEAQAALDYAYEEDILLDRPITGQTRGRGWSADVILQWQPNPIWYGRVEIRDAISRLEWPAAPYTVANLNAVNRFQTNEQISVDPVVSGIEGHRDHTQVLPWFFQSTLAWKPAIHRRAQVDLFRYLNDSWLSWTYRWASRSDLNRWVAVSVIAPQQAAGLTFNIGAVRVGFTTDALDLSKARWLSGELLWQWRF